MSIPKPIGHDSYFQNVHLSMCRILCRKCRIFRLELYFKDEETALEEFLVHLILANTDFMQV